MITPRTSVCEPCSSPTFTWAPAPRADQLLDFLRCCEADVVYLVGDIIDFWRVRRGPYWPQTHNDVLQKLMRKVRKGTKMVLIRGNHDEALRDYAGMQFGGVEIHKDYMHVTALGRRYREACNGASVELAPAEQMKSAAPVLFQEPISDGTAGR